MAKNIKITAVGCIKYDGETYQPGETFTCETKEAERLKGLGVATDAAVKVTPLPASSSGATAEELELQKQAETQKQAELAAQAHAELLAKLAIAANREELEALLPEEAPTDEVQLAEISAAFDARLKELTEPE